MSLQIYNSIKTLYNQTNIKPFCRLASVQFVNPSFLWFLHHNQPTIHPLQSTDIEHYQVIRPQVYKSQSCTFLDDWESISSRGDKLLLASFRLLHLDPSVASKTNFS